MRRDLYLIRTQAITACDLKFAAHEKGERHWKHLPWDPFKVPITVKTQKIMND